LRALRLAKEAADKDTANHAAAAANVRAAVSRRGIPATRVPSPSEPN
jgi:hypothetical protein